MLRMRRTCTGLGIHSHQPHLTHQPSYPATAAE
jgi:hypothetical protein